MSETIKRFICNVCGFRTHTAQNLQLHQRTARCKRIGEELRREAENEAEQMGEELPTPLQRPPFWCDLCKRDYRTRRYLRIHNGRMHRGGIASFERSDGLFLCDLCGSERESQLHLSAHRRTDACEAERLRRGKPPPTQVQAQAAQPYQEEDPEVIEAATILISMRNDRSQPELMDGDDNAEDPGEGPSGTQRP